jgi:hypothetical protein
MNTQSPSFSMSMRGILLLGGMYTVAWAAFFKYLGQDLLKWLSMNPEYIGTSDGSWLGVFGLLIGLSIFLSAFYPISWRYLILAGIFGKIISSSWFVLEFSPILGWNKRTYFYLFFNEILWIGLLSFVVIRSNKVYQYLKNLPE